MGDDIQRNDDASCRPPCRLRAISNDGAELTAEQLGKLAGECEAHRADLESQNAELRGVQQQLQRYRDRYVDLYDFAPLGYATLDEDGYVQEINLAGATMLAAERDGLIGFPFTDFVAESDRDRFLKHVRECTRSQQEQTAEIGLVAKDGRQVIVQLRSLPLSDDPQTIFCKTAVTDITERHRAEAACRDAETRLRLALQAAKLGTWQWDLAADRLACDERGNALMGLAPGVELNFQMVFEIIHPDDHQKAVAQLMEAQSTPGDYESEFRARWPDGSIHWIFIRGRSTRDAEGQVRLTGVSMEITERKEYEENLLAAKTSAEQAKAAAEEAIRIKDQFLALLSHELRKPLTPVVMGVDLLLARGDLPPEARRTLEMIGRNAETEARLINELLDLSQIAQGNGKRVAESNEIAAGPHTSGSLRILLVEDHGITADILRMVLEEAGHQVELANDMSSALKLADARDFELLMSDLGLPDGSGLDLLNELRARGHSFPAIALSGFGREEEVKRSIEAGFTMHLVKPASRDAVIAAVADAVKVMPIPSRT